MLEAVLRVAPGCGRKVGGTRIARNERMSPPLKAPGDRENPHRNIKSVCKTPGSLRRYRRCQVAEGAVKVELGSQLDLPDWGLPSAQDTSSPDVRLPDFGEQWLARHAGPCLQRLLPLLHDRYRYALVLSFYNKA